MPARARALAAPALVATVTGPQDALATDDKKPA